MVKILIFVRVRYNVMTTKELILLTDKELDSRQLARPQIRKKAVRKVVEFMEKTGSFIEGNELALPSDKKEVETGFSRYHPGTVYGLNGAINLIYQIANGNIIPNVNSSLSSKGHFNDIKRYFSGFYGYKRCRKLSCQWKVCFSE